jgi:hypothetical protein
MPKEWPMEKVVVHVIDIVEELFEVAVKHSGGGNPGVA